VTVGSRSAIPGSVAFLAPARVRSGAVVLRSPGQADGPGSVSSPQEPWST
jgi:hypothetical protein